MLGTLEKATTVLSLFSRTPEWGVSQVARELDLPKSSTHALLKSLAQTGMLEHTASNRYRLGWRLLALSRNLLDTSQLRCHARPAVEALRSRFDVTVHVATLNEGQITYLEKAPARRGPAIRFTAVGGRAPAHCTALGKALLASQPSSVIEEAADMSRLHRYTGSTICKLSSLHEELSRIREHGYACDTEEMLPEVRCYAAPILDVDSRAVAAISISTSGAVNARSERDHFTRVVVSAGQRIRWSLMRASSTATVVSATGTG